MTAKELECYRCGGTGREGVITCTVCRGHGSLPRDDEIERQMTKQGLAEIEAGEVIRGEELDKFLAENGCGPDEEEKT